MKTLLLTIISILLFISTIIFTIENYQLRKERDDLTTKLQMCNETIDIINSFEYGDSITPHGIEEAKLIQSVGIVERDSLVESLRQTREIGRGK